MAEPIRLFLRVVALLPLWWVAVSQACQIPVFRYALERWSAEPYEVTVFRQGPLNAAQQTAVDWLKQGEDSIVNLKTELVDLEAKPTEEQRALWAAQSNASLPWMVVRYGHAPAEIPAVFAGPLDGESVRALMDSPARREIVRRILGGDSAVWVVVESGDKARDDSIAGMVQVELGKAEKTLKLPDLDGDKEGPKLLSELPLKLAFSVVRISRSDAAERVLSSMLLNSEKELGSGPAVFPIFGRGRVLGALAGEMISAERIAQGAGFIVGECSCQVKGLNPGFDLLVAADWEGLLAGEQRASPSFLAERVAPTAPLAEGAVGALTWRSAAVIAGAGALLIGGLAWRTRTRPGRIS